MSYPSCSCTRPSALIPYLICQYKVNVPTRDLRDSETRSIDLRIWELSLWCDLTVAFSFNIPRAGEGGNEMGHTDLSLWGTFKWESTVWIFVCRIYWCVYRWWKTDLSWWWGFISWHLAYRYDTMIEKRSYGMDRAVIGWTESHVRRLSTIWVAKTTSLASSFHPSSVLLKLYTHRHFAGKPLAVAL